MRTHTRPVGNDFLLPTKKQPVKAEVANVRPATLVAAPSSITKPALEPSHGVNRRTPPKKRVLKGSLKGHSIAVYALAVLVLFIAILPLGKQYFSSNIKFDSVSNVKSYTPSTGLNTLISSSQFSSWLQSVTSQSAILNLGTTKATISPATIKSWLQITPDNDSGYYVHVKTSLISSSLLALANQYVVAPANQVTITRDDGSSEVAYGGHNGTELSDPSSISTQAAQISKNLFSAKGFQVNSPLTTVPFQNVTPSAFSKLLVADINSKKMYAFQNGQLVRTFLVSAGAPATPTPIGEFHIWEKLTVQDMSGYGPTGYYFQPHVYWVNYFTHTGDAVHGVYWHPLSWFGVHNSSHGCVGVSDSDGEWIYNWAPIGTTVITTPN